MGQPLFAGGRVQRSGRQSWLPGGGCLLWAVYLTLPVFLTAMVLPWLPGFRVVLQAPLLGFPLGEVVKWAFTTPVQFWIGARFHVNALKALRNGRWAV